MIGRLTGQIGGRGTDRVLVDVGGVGYVVEVSARVLSALPADGDTITLAIETYVREEQLRLFGFANEEERGWFRLLMSVQGVGARVALAIQGVLSVQDLAQAIAMEDKEMVMQAPGVGAKVAQRIVQELKNKIPDEQVFTLGGALGRKPTDEASTPSGSAAAQETLSALLNLGYPRMQAHRAVQMVLKNIDGDAQTQDMIKLALKELSKELS